MFCSYIYRKLIYLKKCICFLGKRRGNFIKLFMYKYVQIASKDLLPGD